MLKFGVPVWSKKNYGQLVYIVAIDSVLVVYLWKIVNQEMQESCGLTFAILHHIVVGCEKNFIGLLMVAFQEIGSFVYLSRFIKGMMTYWTVDHTER